MSTPDAPIQRSATLHFDDAWRNQAIAETNHDEFYRAAGRLATWGMGYDNVDIYTDGSHDMVAVFRRLGGEVTHKFVIGAVWDGTRYGFHS